MLQEHLMKALGRIQNSDDELYAELRNVRKTEKYREEAKAITLPEENIGGLNFEVAGPGTMGTDLAQETIVLRVGRPVLAISGNEAILEFRDAESEVWRNRLLAVKAKLAETAAMVGRIDLLHDPYAEWVGTGWLVGPNTLVTNRHVAKLFAEKKNSKFVFKPGTGGHAIQPSVDFLQEAGRNEQLISGITEVLYIEDDGGPDVAFLALELGGELPGRYIPLASGPAGLNQQVAVIGYPAMDSRIPDHKLVLDIFGDVYNKKRLAPGLITGRSDTELQHDCSTLGGNSGSVVLDLETGEAVGLHFAGRFLENNFAVPAQLILDRLNRLENSATNDRPDAVSYPTTSLKQPIMPNEDHNNQAAPVKFQIPLLLNITVTLSGPGTHIVIDQQSPFVLPANTISGADQFITEGKPADYSDRDGFARNFLGPDFPVELPCFTDTIASDRLGYEADGKSAYELTYRHFSVVMSRCRRQCYFSAVNIDGKSSVPMARGPWRLDPRIPADAQIMKECYGSAPRFSRGHMTRREDPIWGISAEAAQGNADSMHVTNTVPQMQTLNAGVWLALENYALQNARKDDMRISVITGPVFSPEDPTQYGVVIPLAFWKIIAFIHDHTGKLTATGYMMSQKDYLSRADEMVYGAHKTNQVPIKEIEARTKLDFGGLAGVDPLSRQTEAAGAGTIINTLERLEQIIFY